MQWIKENQLKTTLGVTLLGICLVLLMIVAMLNKHQESELRLQQLAQQNTQVKVLLQKRGAKPERFTQVQSLLPWLERELQVLDRSGSKAQIIPRSVVDGGVFREFAAVRFQTVSLQSVLPFIERLERNPQLMLRKANLVRNPDQGVDLEIEIGVY